MQPAGSTQCVMAHSNVRPARVVVPDGRVSVSEGAAVLPEMHHMRQGGEGVKKAIAVILMVVVLHVTACAPEAPTPTPTPEPRATPVWVLATKPEHLAGIWYNPSGELWGMGPWYRFEADGTVQIGRTLEALQEHPFTEGRFWFEGGVYYEEGQMCVPIGSYRVHLDIEEGTAVGLRFEEIDDRDYSCSERLQSRRAKFARVD
jgi:hypothetical protein